MTAVLAPRWKKVIHDLRINRSRTIFVVASVAVGVFAVSVILGGRGILLREFDRGYAQSNPAAVTIYARGFDSTHVTSVERVDGVGAVDARTSFSTRYTTDEDPGDTSVGWGTLDIEALDDFDSQSTGKVQRVESSTWPPGPGEIVIEQAARSVEDFAIGDTLTVESASGTRARLRIVGFAWDINAMPAPYVNKITGYVDPSSLVMLDAPQSYTVMRIATDLAEPTRADHDRIAEDAREVLEQRGVTVLFTNVIDPGEHFMGDVFKALALLLLALGLLALLLSGFLVVNTISALMSQHTRQIGIMKAVGGRAAQISRMYLVMVAVLGVAALALGIPLGAWAGQGLVDYAAEAMNFRVDSIVPPLLPMAIAVLVGLLVPVLSALAPISRGAKTPIVRALNPGMGDSMEFGHGLLDRILGSIRGLPRPVALSLRNTFLRKGRLVMTLATLVLACAVVMAVVSIRVSIDDTVDVYATHWSYDLRVKFTTPQPVDAVRRITEGVPGVTDSEAWTVAGVSLTRSDGSKTEGIQVFGMPADTSYYNPDITAGRWIGDDGSGEVVVNADVVDEDPSMRVGSTIELTAQGESRAFQVVGLTTSSFDGPAVYVSEDDWVEWTGRDGLVDQMFVRTTSSAPARVDRIGIALEERLDEKGYPINEVIAQHEVTGTFARQMGILLTFLFIMAGVLGAVGVIGLSGSMMINVIESTREIGVMRAIGASNGSIYSIFITEGVVVAFMAWMVGAVLSWPISAWLTDALATAVGFPLYYRFSVAGVFITLGLVMAIAVLASIVPSWRAAGVSVRDAISYE